MSLVMSENTDYWRCKETAARVARRPPCSIGVGGEGHGQIQDVDDG